MSQIHVAREILRARAQQAALASSSDVVDRALAPLRIDELLPLMEEFLDDYALLDHACDRFSTQPADWAAADAILLADLSSHSFYPR